MKLVTYNEVHTEVLQYSFQIIPSCLLYLLTPLHPMHKGPSPIIPDTDTMTDFCAPLLRTAIQITIHTRFTVFFANCAKKCLIFDPVF